MSFPIPNFELKGARLSLRPVEETHLNDIFAYAQRPEVSRYTMWEPHRSIKETRAFYQDYILSNYSVGVPEPLGLFLHSAPKRLVGMVGIFNVSEHHRSWELAYVLHPDLWGQGLIAEAAQALLDWAFVHLDMIRLQCRAKAPNHASVRIMEKIGLIYEGELRQSLIHRGHAWNMKMFSLTVDEWWLRQKGGARRAHLSERQNLHPNDHAWKWEGPSGELLGELVLRLSDDDWHGEFRELTGAQASELYFHALAFAQLVGVQHLTVARDLFDQDASFFVNRGFCPKQMALKLRTRAENG